MNKTEVIEFLEELCRDIFDDDEYTYNESAVRDDVDGWDSLTHLELIIEVQNEYSIKFSLEEIQSIKTMGQLVELILSK